MQGMEDATDQDIISTVSGATDFLRFMKQPVTHYAAQCGRKGA